MGHKERKMTRETVLVVDDEPSIVQFICERLGRDGFSVASAHSGEEALSALAEESPDLIILDLMLPGMDGFEVLRRLRREGNDTPVVVLTARDSDVDVIVGLELGADDYMVKPFNPRELSARIRAVLRRRADALALAERVAELEARMPSNGPDPQARRESYACELQFEPASRRVWYQEQQLDLRAREYDLLHFLARHPGQILTRTMLLDRVWGLTAYIDERTVDVHVHRLRKKLAQISPEDDPIRTERGIGYRLEP